ncbi:hypothetical protein LCGC14_1117190 [marine sediment metagenome]|uniref:Uncharacterized protein n=1 Tax=marine sediment metagenome TaxID=412755 RepID=A0A0F9QAU8_9ZZZZ
MIFLIKRYYKIRNWTMIFQVVKLHVCLALRVKCQCPFGELKHRVETIHRSRTAYVWDNKGKDPNGPWICCEAMAEEDHQHWNDRWDEYYREVL